MNVNHEMKPLATQYAYPEPMKHIKKASTEGWQKLVTAGFISSGLVWGIFLLDIPVFMRILFFLILTFVTGIALVYSVVNILNKESFICRLTETDFSQASPHSSAGESFTVKHAEISRIEIFRSTGEVAQIHYFLHTDRGRYRISNNYGNPARKFFHAIQKALPHIKTIETSG